MFDESPVPHLENELLKVQKLIISKPLSPDDGWSEVLAKVVQDDDVVPLGVDLEETDVVQELL